MEFNAKKCNHVDLISSKAQRMLNLMILVQRNYSTLLGFGRALNMLAWYGHLIPNETSTIWNKSKAGPRDSLLVGIILGTSALVN